MRMLAGLLWVAILLSSAIAAESHPRGFETHPWSASTKPVTKDGVTTFHILDRECSTADFGDGRGESDCLNGTVRSTFRKTSWDRVGDTKSYRFDLLIDPKMTYKGIYNNNAVGFLPSGDDSRLRLAYWEGELLHNFIYHLKVSTTTGLTFEGALCQARKDFGTWVSFAMDIRWTDDDRGWIRVSCDDRVIYLKEAIASVQAPQCFGGNVCEPGVPKHPTRINFVFGANMWGNGMDWKNMDFASRFNDIEPGGITIKARNLTVTDNPVLYGEQETAAVKELQAVLAMLGCDAGPADGVPGKKTRTAAMDCRVFPEGQMPAEFNVASVGPLLELYTGPGVADLPRGGPAGLAEPGIAATITSIDSLRRDEDTRVDTRFRGTTADGITLDFGISGTYAYSKANFVTLNLSVALSSTPPDGLAACGGRVTEIGGSTQAVFKLKRDAATFTLTNVDCIAEVLPKSADQVRYLAGHFRDFALSLGKADQIDDIAHEGLEAFITSVAAGEVFVVAAAP